MFQLDLLAPGESVISAALGGGDESSTGTSVAASIVSGLIAVFLSAGMTSIYSELQTHTVDLGDPGRDDDTGWGRVFAAMVIDNWSPSSTVSELPFEGNQE